MDYYKEKYQEAFQMLGEASEKIGALKCKIHMLKDALERIKDSKDDAIMVNAIAEYWIVDIRHWELEDEHIQKSSQI